MEKDKTDKKVNLLRENIKEREREKKEEKRMRGK